MLNERNISHRCTGFGCDDDAVTGFADRNRTLPAFRIAMRPVFDFLRIVAETAGRKNDGFCADGVGIAFLICSFRTDDCAFLIQD